MKYKILEIGFLTGSRAYGTADEFSDWDIVVSEVIGAEIEEMMDKANEAFDKDLVFFSDKGQFILFGSKAITAETAVLVPTTKFESDLSVNPVASGDGIFFTFNYGQYTGVREFYTDSVLDTKRARPITDHVKKYLSGSPQIMAASTNLNMLGSE